MPAHNNRTPEWVHTQLSPAEASELGRVIGSEAGSWYGSRGGAVSSITLGFMLPYINGSTSVLPMPLILPLMVSAGYFLGSYFGEKQGAAHCKKIVGNLPLDTNHTTQTVWDLCDASINAFKLEMGFIGLLAATSIGVEVVPEILGACTEAYALYTALTGQTFY